ncbi:43kDa postsynaptic protein [Parasponia andersonii]|uniref:RING-type E3 ubiquitin transferase n=1 Tax=Parasponia andersonii TaxID=3476 RepID=A0A2P5CJ76_PARAD|nr:43kDa postsynaptic protein [Parasponia andersonii]
MEIVISAILLFVGIAVLVVIHVCIVGRAFRRGNQGLGTAQGSNITVTKNMSSEDLKMIPCFDYMGGDNKGTSPLDCAVCLENFKTGDKCRLLPSCGHSFHSQCIDSWLLKASICPICRTSAKVPKSGVGSGEVSGVSHDNGIEMA